MTKSVEDVRRAAFEAIWPMPENCIRCGNTYAATSYKAWQAVEFIHRWEGFNAALDAVEIHLPERDAKGSGSPDSEMGASLEQYESVAYNFALEDCRAAIEQTGLGLRVK